MDDTPPIRGHIRSTAYRRVSHGLFLPMQEGLDTASEWRRDLRAWQHVLPPSAVFTGLTAARLAGWCTPTPAADWVPIFAAVPAPDPVSRRAGLVVSQFARPPGHGPWLVRGFPVDRPAEVLLRCARDLGLLDLVPLVESALRSKDLGLEDLRAITASRRPGVRNLREAMALADVRRESPMETVLRLFLWCMDIEADVQPELCDAEGRFIARADLRVKGTKQLIEYDGAVHRDARVQRSDMRRERRLVEAGYERRAYELSELLTHPAVAMAELDRALGRIPKLSRLRRWKDLTALSAYSQAGRTRLRSRWAVHMKAFIPRS